MVSDFSAQVDGTCEIVGMSGTAPKQRYKNDRKQVVKNAFSVVPGSYDQGETPDAGRHLTDRSRDRTGGCKDSVKQQKSRHR